jgi:3-hydroxyisobutyrate dehydrogenase-like beta-hydroxyacid dehydrogenase
MQIGFIGVGTMGRPMADNLLRHGYKLNVFDRNPLAINAFAGRAHLAKSAAECARCDAVIVMVAFDDQVRDVVEEIALAEDRNNNLIIAIMSTVLPKTMNEILLICQDRKIGLIDAPVMGMPARAIAGKLVVVAGGELRHVESLRPIFSAFSVAVHHMGELTKGQLTKLINNMIAVTNLFLFGEALNLSARFDLDVGKLVEIMETGGGRSFFTQDWQQSIANFSTFTDSKETTATIVDICRKDIGYAKMLARSANMAAPLLEASSDAVADLAYEHVLKSWRSIVDRAK